MTRAIEPAGNYTSADVARLVFDREVEWFYAHRARLHAEEHFPQPICKIGNPRWRGSKLIAWLERPDFANRAAAGEPAPPSGPNVVGYDRLLKERARKVAGKRRSA